ncbi:TPA: MinD/ParA family protein [Serratia odorifera]
MTFDQILPELQSVFLRFDESLQVCKPILINRDLNSRVRLIVDNQYEIGDKRHLLDRLATEIFQVLGEKHAYVPERALLFEENVESECFRSHGFLLADALDDIYVVDRLATPTDWSQIIPISVKKNRTVFFSIKGGVGRSSAMAAAAWALAESGKKVMVLDLDLESPGLSSALLPDDRRPGFGIADWLVEDLLGNGDAVLSDMVAVSALSHSGDIWVVPAHGKDPGEYIAKLGRAWMPLKTPKGMETWAKRLGRLLNVLEERWQPDVVLIDSRAGIDEVASACLTELGAANILLFALNGSQTWSGYRILFKHWHRTGVIRDIRERLQLVGAMLPDLDTANYFDDLRQDAWNLFSDELYDEVPAATEGDFWNYDIADESAPHHPLAIRWHRSFAGLKSLHGRFNEVDGNEVKAIFGPLIDYIQLQQPGDIDE